MSKPERGGCLTIYLLILIVFAIFSLLGAFGIGSLNQQLAEQGYVFADIPGWYVPAQVVIGLITLVSIYGIFTWKKWGVYGVVASWVLGLAAGAMIGTTITLYLVIVVVELLLLVVALRGKWASFQG